MFKENTSLTENVFFLISRKVHVLRTLYASVQLYILHITDTLQFCQLHVLGFIHQHLYSNVVDYSSNIVSTLICACFIIIDFAGFFT